MSYRDEYESRGGYGDGNERRDDYGGREDYGGNKTHGGAYPAGGGYGGGLDDDFSGASEHARRHAGDSGDGDLFSSLIGALGQKKHSVAEEDIDEDEAVRHHKRYYGDGDDGGEVDDKGVGSAAAMQALKMFSGSGGSSHGDNSQSAFIGMAMGEASKLFDQKASQGQVSGSSSKESAVMKAGEMALKMYLKSNGASGGGSGGASGLLGLASKFL